ncbi:MAG: ATP-dependent RecD-like DNA helicase [Candidatus Abyssubacteria bacterium]
MDEHTLEGTIERVVYFNEENGYAVARLASETRVEPVTVVGHLAEAREGERIRVAGKWEQNRKFGPQFRVERCEIVPPSSAEGIERYLASGLFKGIGPIMAKRIVQKFGEDTLRIITEEPRRLREVRGIGRKTLDTMTVSWQQHKNLREAMIFLQGYGITPTFATKIVKEYGSNTVRVIKEDPYRLTYDIHGIGFKQADTIARRMGVPPDSPARAAAAALHVLGEKSAEGHVYYPLRPLTAECADMLKASHDLVQEGLSKLIADAKIVVTGNGDDAVYLRPLHISETGAAEHLKLLRSSLKLLPPIDPEKAASWFEKRHSLRLNAGQRDAIRKAIRSKLLVITGGPGTGKTTLIKALVDIFQAKKQCVQLAAPTGRAAKKMEESAGIPASTIHRLLEFSPAKMGFARDRDNPLDLDILIIDEASMLDIVLLYHLLKATPVEANVIFVGDADQLPSVGPGNVLKDLIESGLPEVARLTEIFRQAEGSLIISNAHRINRGEEPVFPHDESARENGFHFIERTAPEEVASTIEMLVSKRIPDAFGMDPLVDVQVLSPMHKGTAGVSDLNLRLQRLLNPSGQQLLHGSRTFKVRDKVMQTKNNYEKEVFNGDLGFIFSIDGDTQQVMVDFDGRIVAYEFSELDELELAYAVSVHKAQGSEYRAVVVPVMTQHYVLLQRNLIYTAITRAKELVVLVGSRNALSLAIRNDRTQQRHSRLARLLVVS